MSLTMYFHFAAQSISESPQVSPEPGSPAVRDFRVQEVEIDLIPESPLPSSSCSSSVASSISSLEQQAAPDNREVLRSPVSYKRTPSPVGTSARRTKRRGECCSRAEGVCLPSPIFVLDLIEERSKRVSEIVAAASG